MWFCVSFCMNDVKDWGCLLSAIRLLYDFLSYWIELHTSSNVDDMLTAQYIPKDRRQNYGRPQ